VSRAGAQDAVQAVVESVFIYPVKSCAAVRVAQIAFDSDGLLIGDREWVVVDAESSVVWQGSHPRLALVRPRLENGTLTLRSVAAGGAAAGAINGSPCEVRIWNDAANRVEIHQGQDEGSAATEFLSSIVGSQLRLVRLHRDALTRAGANPLHLVSRSSVDELGEALARGAPDRVAVERFRPNVVIAWRGEPLLPFLEEQFTALQWHDGSRPHKLVVSGPCVRCVVPNVDPATGDVDDATLHAINELSAQRHPGGPSCFGVYARATGPAVLSSGTIVSARLTF
jgi:uncharacterized protein YcbX